MPGVALRLDPKKEAVFKLLFGGSEPLLIALLTVVLKPKVPIRRAIVQNDGLPRRYPDNKGNFLDILVVLKDGTMVDVEMQLDDKGAFPERALYYSAGLVRDQLKEGGEYCELRPVVSVLFLNYRQFDFPDFHEVFRLTGTRTGGLFSPLIEFHTIELPKLTREQARTDPALARWCRYFSSKDPREIERLTQEDPMIETAERRLLELGANPELRDILAEEERREAAYLLTLGAAHHKGREEGREEGKAEGQRQLVETLLQEKFGPLSDEVRARLADAGEAQLTQWAKRFRKATTVDDVFG